MSDRRGLTVGVILCLLGLFFLLRRAAVWSGPGPILILIGAILFAVSASRSFRGPLLPGGVLVGLGTGFLLQGPLEAWFPRWATLLLGLSGGFFLTAFLDRATGRDRRPAPLLPAVILLAIALVAAASRRWDLSRVGQAFASAWPWLVIAAGVVLVATSLRARAGR